MRLVFPWALLLLLVVLKMIVDHFSRGRAAALSFSSLAPFKEIGRTPRQRLMPALFWLRVLALLLLIFSLTRPQKEVMTQGIPRKGIAIELVVDTSSSMDIAMPYKKRSISRMEVSKKVVTQFVQGGEKLGGRPNDLIGLVTFARYADTICPLTLSHDSLLYFIEELEIESRPSEDGTALGDAISLAAARLKTAEERYSGDDDSADSDYTVSSKVIILLTDGNNNCGRHLPMEGAALAEHWGIRVHVIAISEAPGMELMETVGGFIEVEGEPEIQERLLQKIAEVTGGIYRRATDAESLHDIYAEINEMETTEIETVSYLTYAEIFQPFAGAGLLLLCLGAVLSNTLLRRVP